MRSILLRDGQVLARKGSPRCASACSSRRSFPGSERLRRRIVSTLDAFSPRSHNVATLPEQLPPVIMSLVVHGYSATVVRLLGVIDSSDVYNRGR